MLARIQAYEAELAKNPVAFFPSRCPACQETGGLRVHELRPRGFWYVVLHDVKHVASYVLRVACKLCGHRTTVLPDFALPHKRYVLPEVIDTSDRYLLDETATYESSTQVAGRPVFHDTDGASRARSTVHRWVGFLGSLVHLLAHATALVLEAVPGFSPLAEMIHHAPRGSRSETRRECLERAHRLLRVRSHLLRATGHDLFPSIATAPAWG